MGLYYSTDMVLRWYKADDSQLKQDRGRTQYTAISNDALVDLREHGITEDNVRQWLEENHVPPDGYTSPYFQLSNHVTRRYCDVHRGPNAKYYRKRMEEVKNQQTEEIAKMLMNQLGNKGVP